MSKKTTPTSNISLSIKENNKSDEYELNQLSETDMLVLEYIDTLTEDEKKAMIIAQEHLETSFCIEKSNGFINWKRKHKK